jgi:hypothetical protein
MLTVTGVVPRHAPLEPQTWWLEPLCHIQTPVRTVLVPRRGLPNIPSRIIVIFDALWGFQGSADRVRARDAFRHHPGGGCPYWHTAGHDIVNDMQVLRDHTRMRFSVANLRKYSNFRLYDVFEQPCRIDFPCT